jgi:hypothetical protein
MSVARYLVMSDDFADCARGESGAATAMILLYAVGIYGLIGLVTAVAFVTLGFSQVLPHSMGASVGARILFIPGAAALWPYVLVRWLRARGAS